MRLNLSPIPLSRMTWLQLLIVVLLIANLLVGARIALGQGDLEGGNPPVLGTVGITGHFGCADVNTGAVRVFRERHQTEGVNAPHDACSPNEYRIVIFFDHDD